MTETTTGPRLEVGDTVTVGRGIRRGTVAHDTEGDEWYYSRAGWLCCAPTDGVRVTRVAQMGTANLLDMYGPAVVVRFDR